jgi:hypothetical protein
MKFIHLPITARFTTALEDEIDNILNNTESKDFNTTCLICVDDITHAIGADNGTTTIYLANGDTLVINLYVGELARLLN